MLTFDGPTHTYRWHGQLVPGVTTILHPLEDWSKVPKDVMRQAQERGTFVHSLTELYDLGQLDVDAVLFDAAYLAYRGYLRAWQSFTSDYDPVWSEIEQMGYSQRFGFAGTWDRAGELLRKAPGRWHVDIKTSEQSYASWGVQTAAYRQIRSESAPTAALDRRATVQLHADGRYTFLPWDEADDWPCFQALLTVHNWSSRR
ncbi:hypothetical protein UFOVP703_10 [uncultured Caudovirales phage]|uniref:PD-(D/E)XK nuclease superfamily n=1 Tax=uncultured Caudovirales phage TaxID=2100421 RepID=A0A6J5NN62_9CAUD|nr:hypothetical protein UFOVP703_10 [uncultured Caudovirales phage]